MKPVPLLGIALLAAGCASGVSSVSTSNAPRTEAVSMDGIGTTNLGTGGMILSRDAGIATAKLAGAPDRVWSVLADLYGELGLPVNTIDTDKHLIGAVRQRVRTIAGKRLDPFFTCGGSYFGNGTYDIYVTVRTQLAPGEGGGTTARTQAQAEASDPGGRRKVPCSSTGELEQLIGQKLAEKAAAKS